MASGMNNEQVKKDNPLEERYNPKPLIVVAVALSIIGFFFFVSHRYYSVAKPIDGSVWGEFGDFIGGVIGTIIAYISIRLLVATLNTQAKGNDVTKEAADLSLYESKLQRLYSNFKMMLELYHSKLAEFNKDDNSPHAFKGLDFLKRKKDAIIDTYNSPENSYTTRNKEAVKLFSDFYAENRPVASVYFRIIYRLLEMIFRAEIESEDKAKFAKMLRCQLSEEELFFIRYNAMTNNGSNMRKLLNQYNMMKHLPEFSLPEFKGHVKYRLNLKDKNQMISSMIDLRKVLLKRDKYSPNAAIAPIHTGYEIESKMNADRHLYTLTLKRPVVVEAAGAENHESFDKLTVEELTDFMKDFVIELFTSYNFCEYQKIGDIRVESHPTTENGHDTINITVTSIDPHKKLHLYIDKDPETSEEL